MYYYSFMVYSWFQDGNKGIGSKQSCFKLVLYNVTKSMQSYSNITAEHLRKIPKIFTPPVEYYK